MIISIGLISLKHKISDWLIIYWHYHHAMTHKRLHHYLLYTKESTGLNLYIFFGNPVTIYYTYALCFENEVSYEILHCLIPPLSQNCMMTLWNGNIFRVTDEFPPQRPVTRSFDVFFDMRMKKRLSKQSRRRWFETPSRSLWRNGIARKWGVTCPVPCSLEQTSLQLCTSINSRKMSQIISSFPRMFRPPLS